MKKRFLIGCILFLFFSIIVFVSYRFRHHVKREFGENGKVSVEMEFNNGLPNGLGMVYFPSGKVKGTMNFKNGKKNGKAIYFYENGKIKMKENFKEDSLDGPKFLYYEDGQKMSENLYRNGKIISGGSFNRNGDSISVHRGNVIRTYGGGKIYVLDCLANTHKNRITGSIKFSDKGEILEYKGPLTCLTKNDTMLLDSRNPEWRNLKTNFKK